MSAARQRMLERNRLIALDSEHLAAEADGAVDDARALLAKAARSGAHRQLTDALRSTVHDFDALRDEPTTEVDTVDAMLAVCAATKALQAAQRKPAAPVPARHRTGAMDAAERPQPALVQRIAFMEAADRR